MQVDRRTLVLGAVLLGTAACGGTATPAARPTATRTSSGTTSTVRSPSAVTPSPPVTTAWHPDRGDVDPAAKQVAAHVVEVLGTWTGGGGGRGAAASRLADVGQPRALAGQAGPLLGGQQEAVVRVLEAQTGGLLGDTASILVPCRQWRRSGSGPGQWGGTTLDVRLVRRGGRWRVTELHPARPGPARPLSDLQRRVLGSTRIALPPAAAADIRSGRVHDSALRALLTLAPDFRIGVSVVRSGHPTYVFGTTRPSDHPQGRAFDTFRIDGRLVVDPATPRRLVTDYMEAAAAAGSDNVGGPYLLTGTGNQFFSDATHHDHVHAGFAS